MVQEAKLKKLYLLSAAFASLALVSCGQDESKSQGRAATPAAVEAPKDAAAVGEALREQGIDLQDVAVLDEKSDTNNLLGRPGQYTSKIFFHDARHPKTPESGDEFEGTIEVFANAADAQKRRDYIEQVTSGMPMLLQYQFLRGNVLVRLPKAFAPSETKSYEDALAKIVPA